MHQYSRNADHIRNRGVPVPSNDAIDEHLIELLSPSVYNQQAYYQSLGMRNRILSLPLMVAAVLTMLWARVPSVIELTRLLKREDLLWAKSVTVTRQAVSQRFLEFPSSVFERVLKDVLGVLKEHWAERSRPVAPSIAYGLQSFEHIWAADGSVLEALFRKLDSLKEKPVGQLAGKICTVIELGSQLPVEVWFNDDGKAHDCQFLDKLFTLATQHVSKVLLVLDRGFYDFEWWRRLNDHSVAFIILGKSNLSYTVVKTLSQSVKHTDAIIEVGTDTSGQFQLRLISIRKGKGTYRYLTSVLDPHVLPPYVVVDLYARRWRIEDAFHLVKRLLGLAYLWTGSINGIKLQIWATWLMYAVLLDLSDAVADAVQLPLDRISPEMVWRGLYHFNTAYNNSTATDPVVYLTAPENRDLSVIKPLRKPQKILDLSPFPGAGNKPLTKLKNA